ncbi:hypothetical protein C0Q70_02221 [Pomacea canaliculata]|uniref:EF-hand domain-containing protein n=1 Tax=Pomacea canaliculata TaxID=400727 RepID=A0A2T7Q1Q3_POMCA|nr:hypothetical protein C0Q70_02221 [Pomacea canaliculata]
MASRPSSAQSRTAWVTSYGNDGIRDDPDLCSDSQVYPGGDKNRNASSAKSAQRGGCLAAIGRGLRSLWATRQTEETRTNRELYVKTTLRELVIYIVFLVVICVITFGMTSTTMYYYTKVMSDLFLDNEDDNKVTFRTMTRVEDFWSYMKGPLLDGLYWENWYNNQSLPADEMGFIYYENKLLGVPRLRQLRVHSNSCQVHDDFSDFIQQCYDAYSDTIEDTTTFGPGGSQYTAWVYKTENELGGSSHWGQLATYSGAGNVQNLGSNKSDSTDIVNSLYDNLWVRRGTRAVFIDFTVYNANINLFCVIRLLVEFPATGGVIPSWTLRTVKLIRYVTIGDYFVMACEVIFCIFILYYTVEEILEIKKHRLSYFKSFWNILDIMVIIIAVVCVAFNLYRTVEVGDKLKKLLENPDIFSDFERLSYWENRFCNAIAIATFLAWIKLHLFRIILGDFDFNQLETANRILGPVFFMLFVFFVFFVLINMFLAIINDTYSEVKSDMANQKNEFEIADYFKKGYQKMLDKLNFKRDKIVDIQKALQSADINQDKQLDFDEWRQDLKTRGYADGEIEAMFAKYDIDGDRVLDEEEQRRMQADLFEQKAALNKEYDELEGKRPGTGRRSSSRVSFDESGEESDDEDSGTKSSRTGRTSSGVSYEEFTVLSRRVDRMEHSIGSIVSKIDAVLVKLEAMEKAKLKRRETMGKILDSITESDGTSDEMKREQMEKLVREELERWDSETSMVATSARGGSPSSSSGLAIRARSRPDSGHHGGQEGKEVGPAGTDNSSTSTS